VLQAVASRLGIDAESLEAALLAHLRSECTAGSLEAALSPERIATEAILRLVNSRIRRARTVRITAC
jgi:hypothetical protein